MVGSVLQDRYRIEALLGRGGMGAVYRARDLTLDRDVAVKVVEHPDLDSEARHRLLHEARAAATLNHPKVVAVHDAGEAGDTPFFVMELVTGGSLRSAAGLTLEQVLSVGRQLCEALAHAHERGIVHRDLKPENVLIAANGDRLSIKVADLGLAFSGRHSRLTQAGAFLGTAAYMAPEQAMGVPVDGRADLYALGVVLYELVAGRPPFPGDDPIAVVSQHLHAPVVPPTTHRPDLPPAFDALILRLLAKRPEDRFASAAEAGAALAAVPLGGSGAQAAPAAPGSDASRLLEQLARGRLVGRTAELERLREFWRRAERGEGHLALISGEPGVGKTRLARELAVYARLQGAWVLQGGCYEFEATTPYLPFVEALRGWVRGRDPARLREALGPMASELAKLAPEIDAKLGPQPPNPSLPPSEERMRLFDHVVRFLGSLATERGLLLVLDDLHWADHGTLALLHYLMRQSRESRVLVLGMYREAELGRSHPLQNALVEWNRERLATRIPLGRLSLADTAAMLAVMFGQNEVASDFAQALHRETEGNPFFVEEVVKALIEQGQIYREAGEWQRHGVEDLAIPQSIKAAVSRRLERLTPACTEVLQTAAALGKVFDFRELAAATAVEENPLLDALDEASASQLIRAESGESFAFTHDKIREVLHEELNPIRQRRLHQRIGESLERLHAGRLDAHAEDLAYHFARSGDLRKGLAYSLEAATQAEKLYAHQEALEFLERARECAEALEDTDPLALVEARLGSVWWALGESKPAAEHYRRAIGLERVKEQRLSLQTRLGEIFTTVGDPQGLPLLESVLGELDPARQPEDTARALALVGRYHHYRGNHRKALEFLERSRELAERTPSVALRGLIYSYLAGAHQHLSNFEESNRWSRRELELGEADGNPYTHAIGHEFLAENCGSQGLWAQAVFHADQDREWGEKAQSQERLAWAAFAKGVALWQLGELAAARELADAGRARARRIGETRVELLIQILQSGLATDLGFEEEGRKLADQALIESTRLGLVFHQVEAHRMLAHQDFGARSWSKVIEHREAALQILKDSDASNNHMWFSPMAAEALLELGRREEAERTIAEAIARSQVGPAPHYLALARRARARWLWADDRRAAGDLLDQVVAELESLGSRIELMRTLRLRAGWRQERGDIEGGRADLERSLALAQECGAVRERERAEAALAAVTQP